jgi:3-deoxy-D-manno-octulosonic-acid transferase
MYLVYSALLALVLLISIPYWLWQALSHGKYRLGLNERFGEIPPRLKTGDSRACIWVHAVSVGEVLAVTQLVEELRTRFPSRRIVVSTTTDTGQKLARDRFGSENVFYFPMDFAFAISPYLRMLRPDLMVIAETEFWPNFLRLAHASGARVAVVNARISDRSLRGYPRIRWMLRSVLNNVDLFLTQTDTDAARLKQIGAPSDRVIVSGNLKFDIPAPADAPIVESLRKHIEKTQTGPVLVCGSTVDDEEPLLLRAFEIVLASYPQALLILAPRHPERFTQVAQLLEKLNIRYYRRSLWSGDTLAGSVLLMDTIGELAALYGLADIAFVGGSLVPRGGHNIIEPARHGVPIVVGNHTENFRDIIGLFQSRDAVRIVGPAELPLTFMELLANPEERQTLGKRAAETLQLQTGATQRTVESLANLMTQPVGTRKSAT